MTRSALLPTLVVASLFAPPALAQQAATHPPEVALVDEDQGSVYRQADNGVRLYIHDGDRPGRSTCYNGCASAWPPLVAPPDAAPVGDWTIISRKDGIRQWAFRGRPIYRMFHDSPTHPQGVGQPGWRLLPHLERATATP